MVSNLRPEFVTSLLEMLAFTLQSLCTRHGDVVGIGRVANGTLEVAVRRLCSLHLLFQLLQTGQQACIPPVRRHVRRQATALAGLGLRCWGGRRVA